MSKPEEQEESVEETTAETSHQAEAEVVDEAAPEDDGSETAVEEGVEATDGAEATGAEGATDAATDAEDAEAEELPPLVPVLEAALFASAEAVPLTRLTRVLGAWTRKQVVAGLKELAERQEREGSGVRVVETAGGFQLRSVTDYSPWVRKFFAEKPPRLSRAVLETLAIVAYRQPATRGEVEAVRGVNCDAVLGALTARGLVQVIGRRPTPGRPVEYGTTQEFLELFSLKTLEELAPLPDPSSLANLIEEARAEEEGAAADGEATAEASGEPTEEVTTGADGDDTPPVEPDGISDGQEAAGEEEPEEHVDDAGGGEAAEASEPSGDRLATYGGVADSGGESPSQREGGPGAGSEG